MVVDKYTQAMAFSDTIERNMLLMKLRTSPNIALSQKID